MRVGNLPRLASGGRICRGAAQSRRNTSRALRTSSDGIKDPELVKAARDYKEALKEGEKSEDEVVASIMGANSLDELSGAKAEYKDKIKAQIAKKAAELEAKQEAGREEFDFGVKLYERGRYEDSERMLGTALDVAGPFSRLGGDIQIQLALAMNANGKEEECIAVFKELQETHPLRAIRRQAEHLCFIMEAPELEIRDDEKVKVPILDLDDNNPRKGKARPSAAVSAIHNLPKDEQSLEEKFWENYQPPSYVTNKYVWAAAAVLGLCSAYYSMLYRDCIPF